MIIQLKLIIKFKEITSAGIIFKQMLSPSPSVTISAPKVTTFAHQSIPTMQSIDAQSQISIDLRPNQLQPIISKMFLLCLQLERKDQIIQQLQVDQQLKDQMKKSQIQVLERDGKTRYQRIFQQNRLLAQSNVLLKNKLITFQHQINNLKSNPPDHKQQQKIFNLELKIKKLQQQKIQYTQREKSLKRENSMLSYSAIKTQERNRIRDLQNQLQNDRIKLEGEKRMNAELKYEIEKMQNQIKNLRENQSNIRRNFQEKIGVFQRNRVQQDLRRSRCTAVSQQRIVLLSQQLNRLRQQLQQTRSQLSTQKTFFTQTQLNYKSLLSQQSSKISTAELQFKTLQAEHQSKISTLQAAHKTQIASLIQQHSIQTGQLRQQFQLQIQGKLQGQAAGYTKQMQAHGQVIQQLRQQLQTQWEAKLQSQVQQHRTQLQFFQSQGSQQGQQIASLQNKISEVQLLNRQLQGELSLAKGQLSQAKSQLSQLSSIKTQHTAIYETLQQKQIQITTLIKQQQNFARQQQNFIKQQQEKAKLQDELQKVKNRLANKEMEIQFVYKRCQQLQGNGNKYENDVRAMGNQLQRMVKKLDQLQQYQNKVNVLSKINKQLETYLKQKNQQLTQKLAESEQQNVQIQQLSQQNENLQNELSSLGSQFRKIKRKAQKPCQQCRIHSMQMVSNCNINLSSNGINIGSTKSIKDNHVLTDLQQIIRQTEKLHLSNKKIQNLINHHEITVQFKQSQMHIHYNGQGSEQSHNLSQNATQHSISSQIVPSVASRSVLQ